MFSNLRQGHQVMKGHSKVTQMHFWMIQRTKIEVFGHFLGFGLLDRLDIAYCGSTKCFPTSGKVTRSWRIIQKSRKCIFGWSKEPKTRFLAIFRGLICWVDLILHIVIVQNVFQLTAMLPGHEGSFKHLKNAFLNDPRGQKCDFWPFSGLWSCWIDLIFQILILVNVFQHLATSPGHEGSFKNHKNALLNDPKCQSCYFLEFSLFDGLDIAYFDQV